MCKPEILHRMSIVAVAGGLGDLGGLIVEALIATGKHEVYVMSRKVPKYSPYILQYADTTL